MAEKLLRLYAEREVSKGFVFSGDRTSAKEFDDFFHYDEHLTRRGAIEEIKSDMETVEIRRVEKTHGQASFRRVGYGATEVAMRAAFRAVYDANRSQSLYLRRFYASSITGRLNRRFLCFSL